MNNINGKISNNTGFIFQLTAVFLLVIILQNQDVRAQTFATQLFDHLFTNYNSAVRPYCGDNNVTSVRLDLALRQIIDLDEPTQTIKMNMWIRLFWTDCQLTWDSSVYGNITTTTVPFKHIWVPDITLFDSTADDFPGYDDYRPTIHSDGSVYYNFPTIIESRCIIDVKKFPYDKQTCSLTFGSWAFHGNEMDLVYKNPHGDLSSSVTNVEWNITDLTAVRHVVYYGCCPEPYPDVTYYLHITRKPKYYVVNIIIPTFLITSISILGFFLPSEAGEKVSLQVTVMLALAVFQLLVADSLPPSADATPLIAVYFTICLFLVGFACVMAVVALNVHYEVNSVMPRWVVRVFLKIVAPKMFVKVSPFEEMTNEGDAKDCEPHGISDTSTKTIGNGNKVGTKEPTNYDDVIGSHDNTSEKGQVKKNGRVNVTPEHWRALAIVVDKLSLIIFVLLGIIGTAIVFSQFT